MSCKNVRVCDALSYLMDNIYKRFGTELLVYVQIVCVQNGTNCAPLV